MIQHISYNDFKVWNPITSIIIFMSLLSLAACGTENEAGQPAAEEIVIQKKETQNGCPDAAGENGKTEQISPKIVDYELLGIEEYIYPSEFSMEDNLKTAITQLALSYESFDKGSVSNEDWKEIFVARFIQNSRLSFDYLDMISEKNNGQISADELNYIQYSLTGIELDFSSYADGFVNRYDDASTLNYGWISEYDYEYTDNGVIVTADFAVGYDGTDSMQERKITVELVRNPYSCFDGYSVVTVSSENAALDIKKDDELENLIGGYDYLSDYQSESSYRFSADSSDIEP